MSNLLPLAEIHSSQAPFHPEVFHALKKLAVFTLALLAALPSLRAQTPAPPALAEGNRKALNTLFDDYWQDQLKHDPEFASTLGDKR